MVKKLNSLKKETYTSPFCYAMAFSAETAILSVSGNIDDGSAITLSSEDVMSDFGLLDGLDGFIF